MPRKVLQASSSLSRRAAMAGMAATTAVLGLDRLDSAAAQEATPTDLAGHPLVGTWAVMTPGGIVPQIHGPDGSVISAFAPNYVDPTLGLTFQGPALGVWEATGERRGHFTVLQALSDADGTYLGTFQFEANPEVSADGRTFVNSAPQRVIVRDAANNVTIDQVFSAPPVTATRVGATMESIVLPVATPVVGTPAP